MIRFLADACLADYIVSGCLRREPAMDFKSALTAKLHGKTDPEVLCEDESADCADFADCSVKSEESAKSADSCRKRVPSYHCRIVLLPCYNFTALEPLGSRSLDEKLP